MADAIFAGLKMLKQAYDTIRELKIKLRLSLKEIKRCETLISFLRESSARVTKHLRQSGDSMLSKSFAPVLEEAGEVIMRIEPLLRRKKRMLKPLEAIIKRLTACFASAQKQIFLGKMAIKASTRLLEKALEYKARASARSVEGGLAQLKAELKAAKSSAYRHGEQTSAKVRQVIAAQLSPGAQKVAQAVQLLKDLCDLLKAGSQQTDGEAIVGALKAKAAKIRSEFEDPGDGNEGMRQVVSEGVAMLCNEANLVKLVDTVFRKKLGVLGDAFEEGVIVKLLGDDHVEIAKRLYVDIKEFNGGQLPDDAAMVRYIQERAEHNVGLLLGLASSHISAAIEEMANEDHLAGQIAELGATVLQPLMLSLAKIGFVMSALVMPPVDDEGSNESNLMNELIAVAKDMADDIQVGSFSVGMFGSIESIGMPKNLDISGGLKMLSTVTQGAALNSTHAEIKDYRKELDEAARILNMQVTTIGALSSTTLKGSSGLNSRALSTMSERLTSAQKSEAAAQLIYSSDAPPLTKKPSSATAKSPALVRQAQSGHAILQPGSDRGWLAPQAGFALKTFRPLPPVNGPGERNDYALYDY
uniref:Uncharacterized protein n=1 Tax=Haptolina brevifila TaxID=156173 RepID=A0A7S2IC47_9EUKA|mmetsp:Transcript_64472/g.127340  ORF Transcript_64472/g.127340 Transcript_64472/m.127340 type:complete len:586 (+) Transcript_64472:59-1816(+)|eukprot:CAMPEP_0174724074 /NCGR_PEP_ID=MMETSP1094-20130205/42597_1 /TAXON_ID=156173 /ORGANISM="Chrysochromulina brevifilum, Strain UTEX LB 985" /LENGTH=585 /DNA_ID=CAMNT_0015925229 /DNA_START=47 /DNA_END=1804 /DNA_ORIENTATION=-